MNFSRKEAFNAAMVMTGATYVIYITGLITNTLIARSLSSDNYGQYAYFVWMVGVLCVLINNALSVSSLRFISEAIGKQGVDSGKALYAWFMRCQSICMLLGLPLAVVFAYLNPPDGWSSPLWVFIAVVAIVSIAKANFMFLTSSSKGFGAFVVDAASNSMAGIFSACTVAVAFFLGAGLDVYIAIFIATTIFSLLVAKMIANKVGVTAVSISVDDSEKLRIWRFMKWTLLLIICNAINHTSVIVYFLNKTDGAVAVGLFVIASSLTKAGMDLLSAGLSSVLMTSMSRAYGNGGVMALIDSTWTSIRYFHFLGLIVAGVGAFWSSPIIGVLYGDRYEGAVAIMIGLSLIGGLTFTDGVLSAALTVMERQKQLVVVAVTSWVVIVASSAALIAGLGIQGAIIVCVVSKAFFFYCLVASTRQFVPLNVSWRPFAVLTIAGMTSALPGLLLLVYADNHSTRLLAGLLYALVLLALSFRTGFWRSEDKAQFRVVASRISSLKGLLGSVCWWR